MDEKVSQAQCQTTRHELRKDVQLNNLAVIEKIDSMQTSLTKDLGEVQKTNVGQDTNIDWLKKSHVGLTEALTNALGNTSKTYATKFWVNSILTIGLIAMGAINGYMIIKIDKNSDATVEIGKQVSSIQQQFENLEKNYNIQVID